MILFRCDALWFTFNPSNLGACFTFFVLLLSTPYSIYFVFACHLPFLPLMFADIHLLQDILEAPLLVGFGERLLHPLSEFVVAAIAFVVVAITPLHLAAGVLLAVGVFLWRGEGPFMCSFDGFLGFLHQDPVPHRLDPFA